MEARGQVQHKPSLKILRLVFAVIFLFFSNLYKMIALTLKASTETQNILWTAIWLLVIII